MNGSYAFGGGSGGGNGGGGGNSTPNNPPKPNPSDSGTGKSAPSLPGQISEKSITYNYWTPEQQTWFNGLMSGGITISEPEWPGNFENPYDCLTVTSVITGNWDGDSVLGPGMQGYEILTWNDRQGNSQTLVVNGVKWGTMNMRNHLYDEPTNTGMYRMHYDASFNDPYKIRVDTPESGVTTHLGSHSAGCPLYGPYTVLLNTIQTELMNNVPMYMIHSIYDNRSDIDKVRRPIYNNRDQNEGGSYEFYEKIHHFYNHF